MAIAISIHTPPLVLLLATLTLLLPTTFSASSNILLSGGFLTAGRSLQYNGYALAMQKDCNLVLYDAGYEVWSTGTAGMGKKCYLYMQGDGNLVIRNGTGPVWSTGTSIGVGQYALVLKPNRDVVILGGAVWAARTGLAVT
ncbi:hypothetical protein QJS04_geneDACA007685 [Acorus gramineus]|uniref:Bulb-type lectin domain-containing protein n=1 Tax=Acorus gramineus TaxID=55184 RepID=A0AAV9B6B3_ACOGR|nr:hypothetical protein QJS04_geneDACA007685 [Acorus gramineus]